MKLGNSIIQKTMNSHLNSDKCKSLTQEEGQLVVDTENEAVKERYLLALEFADQTTDVDQFINYV